MLSGILPIRFKTSPQFPTIEDYKRDGDVGLCVKPISRIARGIDEESVIRYIQAPTVVLDIYFFLITQIYDECCARYIRKKRRREAQRAINHD